MRRRTIVVSAVAGVLVAVPVAAYGLLAVTTGDSPERAALDAAPEPARAAADGQGPDRLDGTWTVAPVETNFVGYRARERLGPVAAPADAVGRTTAVDGSLTIEGDRMTALDLTVDMTTLRSDSSGRDERVDDQVLEVARFPTAEFHLDEPIESKPPALGVEIELSVPGRLTLRDETHPATFEIQTRWNGPTIQAAGSTDIERSDFGVGVQGLAGFNVDETITIEFELTFAPQDAAVDTPPPTLVDNPATVTDEEPTICANDGTDRRLTRPLLVTATDVAAGGQPLVGVVSGAGPVTPVVALNGLTGGVSWSQAGREVVYSASDGLETPRGLVRVSAEGGPPTAVPGLSNVLQPDAGPDGRIVFVQRTGETTTDIWVTDPTGANPQPLAATPGEDSDPRWAPDGDSVVFTTVAGADNQDVVVVDADGTGLRTVAGGPGYEFAPSVTADGTTVLFSRDGALHSVGIDGEDERQLSDSGQDVNPELSPDGTQLAFLRDGSLFVADADGSSPTCVETGQPITGGPRWQPR